MYLQEINPSHTLNDTIIPMYYNDKRFYVCVCMFGTYPHRKYETELATFWMETDFTDLDGEKKIRFSVALKKQLIRLQLQNLD